MKVRTSNWLFGIILILVVGISLVSTSCTQNSRAKKYGGNMTINLEPNEKLVNMTWKDSNLWVLTRPMLSGEQPQVYKFKEKSPLGIIEGTITIIETGGSKPTSYMDKKWMDIGNPPEWFVNEQKEIKLAIAIMPDR
jgi:hypothetical protein